ncbi:ATP-binding protein [Deinococcus sp.]|uniref:ATP-binding protein n=1 Tax=Deinococcus sp. TaxID=47478 RepID=UPI003CC675A0
MSAAQPVTSARWRGWLRRALPAPLAVLLLVLLLTVAATVIVRGFVRQQQTARFELEVSNYERDLRQRLQNYTRLLTAARAAWEASDGLTGSQFERLVQDLDLASRAPGVLSLGYAPLVSAAHRASFAQNLPFLSEMPGAKLHPVTRLPLSVPVLYLAPAIPTNRAGIGLDMYFDPVRRRAIQAALDSGQVRATGQLIFANPTVADRVGILLFLPAHAAGRAVGLLYVPVQFSALLPQPAPLASGERLALSVALDGQELENNQPLAGDFFRQHLLDVAGQRWTLGFSAPADFGRGSAATLPWAVLLGGLVVAILAALATQAQVRARQRAEETSQRLTRSQQSLERSRAEFEAVFRAIQDTAIFADDSGRVLFANDALSQSFGLRPEELRGSALSELHVDPLLLTRLDTLPGPHLVTTLFRRRGGADFYGEMQRSEVLGERGERLGQLEVIRDISERLQAERNRREGERRYQGVLEAMPQIVFLTDAAGHLSYVNQRWTDYVGHTAPAFTQPASTQGVSGLSRRSAVDIVAFVHPDDRADFTRRWEAALRGGRELEIEHRLRSRHGVYRTFVTRGRPVRGANGEVLEWVASSTDIDDQVYSELNSRLLADFSQMLSARAPLLGDAAATSADGPPTPGDLPASADLPSELLAASQPDSSPDRALAQALHLMTLRFADVALLWQGGPEQPREWQGPLLVSRGRLAARPETALALLNELARGAAQRPEAQRTEPSVVQDERLHDYGLSALVFFPLTRLVQPAASAALPAEGGADELGLLGLGLLGLGFRQPVHDRELEVGQELAQRLSTALDNRRLLARLQGAQNSLQDLNNSLEGRVLERTAQLHEANIELEAFSYSVSHDLRTPLRHILGFADLFRKESGAGLSDKGQRYLKVITEAAGRMSTLIDDLLEFSRTSRTELRLSSVDLDELVESSIRDLAPDVGERRVEWRVPPLAQVSGDPALLRQVFDNLLSNALKYTRTREQALIEVSARVVERELWIGVRDNGVGFDPEYADKLFGVFQRLHRSEEFEGTGIGLANVRRIVARHGGRVWAESGLPTSPGATFWLALPYDQGSPQPAPPLSPPQDPTLSDAPTQQASTHPPTGQGEQGRPLLPERTP